MTENEKTPENGAGSIPVAKASKAFTNPDDVFAELAAREAAGRKTLSAPEILAANHLPIRVVDVPGWGGQVLVRALSGTARDAFEASLVQTTSKGRTVSTSNIRAKLVSLSIIDPADKSLMRRLFTDEQVLALGALSATDLSTVYDVAATLSGISAGDVEELGGNSAAAVSDGSSQKSP